MTKRQMFVRMTLSSLMRRRSRMLVALLAVALGAAVLFGLVTIYRDVPRQMSSAFRSYGANLILTPANKSQDLNLQVLTAVNEQAGNDRVVGIAPFRYENIRINEQPFIAAGTDFEQVRKTSPYWGVQGKWPQQSGQILIGREVAEHIRAFVGDRLTVTVTRHGGSSDLDLTVSGILETGSTEEGFVYMSEADLTQLTGYDRGYDAVECSIKGDQHSLRLLSENIIAAFPAVKAQPVERVAQSEGRVLSRLQALVWIVTLVVMVLTMVCVATTMLAAAAERRQEIGLRKALGASSLSIVRQFMAESLLLGALGGILGAILGYFFALYVSRTVFASPVNPDPLLGLITVITAIAVTGISSYLPVYKASLTDPAIVLRGE